MMNKRVFSISILLLFLGIQSFSITIRDKQICDYFSSFFHNKETISFLRPPGNNIINAYDPDSILTRCHISSWVVRKLNIITEGNDIQNIRTYGIFTSVKDSSDFIIVSKNTIKDITYYRIFRYRTGRDGHFGIKLENNIPVKMKTIYGHF